MVTQQPEEAITKEIGEQRAMEELAGARSGAMKGGNRLKVDVEMGHEAIDLARIDQVYKYDSQAASDQRMQLTQSQLIRKLDWRILPAFWTLYFLCSAIRSNVGLAQTMNLEEAHDLASELHLTKHQISTGLALFYVCYVIFDFPSNLFMSRLSPRVWMSRIVVGVGIIGACMAAMKAAWSF
jgi:hypothetical protein